MVIHWFALNSPMMAYPLAGAGGASRKNNPVLTALIAAAAMVILIYHGIRAWTRRSRNNGRTTAISAIVRPWRSPTNPVAPGPAPEDWARQRAHHRIELRGVVLVVLALVLLALMIVDLVR